MIKLVNILKEIKISPVHIDWDNLEEYVNDKGFSCLGDGKHYLDIDTVNNVLLIYNKKNIYKYYPNLIIKPKVSQRMLLHYVPLMKQMFEDGHYKLVK